MIREFVRRRPFVAYYALATMIGIAVVIWRYYYAFGYTARTGQPFDYNEVLWQGLRIFNHGSLYPNIISIGWVAAMREPIFFGVFLFAGAPTISAIIVSYVGWGADGVKRLFARFKLWPSRAFRRDALISYAIIVGVFAAFTIGHLILIRQYVGQAALEHVMTPFGLPVWLFPLSFVIGGFIDEGATCEELGWRGFGMPTLLDRMSSPLAVAILLGTLWWAWHFPREVPALMAHGFPDGFWSGQAEFLMLVVAITVVMTYFFHRTGGSVIPAIMLHGWGNYLNKGVSLYPTFSLEDRTWLFVVAAIFLAVVTKGSLGRKHYLATRAAEAA